MSFIVVFDDEQGLCCPYGWDDDCEGAICCSGLSVAVFPDRKTARRAITISQRYAKLRESQGKTVNDDFTTSVKFVKILPLVERKDGA